MIESDPIGLSGVSETTAVITPRLECVPVPGWVEHRAAPAFVKEVPDAYIDNGLLRLLFHSQISIEQGGFAHNFRTVQRIVTRGGAERASQFAVEFAPSTQRVEVHFINVLRGGGQIEHANQAAIHLLRRETKLERLILDGRLTASLLIPDLRIDDELDVSFTIYTSNKVLGFLYSGWHAFNGLAPWVEARHRLMTPTNREVFEKAFNDPPEAEVEVDREVRTSIWNLSGQARVRAEELSPPWFIQTPAIQFTEFRSWNQVATLFGRYYAGGELPAELIEQLGRIAAAHSDPKERAAEWLRFVQRQLRYFALSLGEGGLVPRELDAIWKSRFGDCKDATRLFVAGATRLGIDACAALTSTTHGMVLNQFLPSPTVFNHCIARLRLSGETYWLDPTMPRQEGRLDRIYQPRSGWALPLSAGTIELERQNSEEPIHYRHCEEDIRLGPKPDSPAALTLRFDFYSFAADAMRHRIENEGQAKYAAQLLGELRTTWPEICEIAPLALQDDVAENRLSAKFQFEIRNAWRPVNKPGLMGFAMSAESIASELNLLKSTERRTDLYLGRPRLLSWRARLTMPRRWSGGGWNQIRSAIHLRYLNELTINKREISHAKELLISAWSVPASESDAYQELVRKARENLTTIHARVLFGRIWPAVGGPLGITRKSWTRIAWLTVWIGYLLWVALKPAFH